MAEHQVASEERASRGRVLLVDDDQDMVELVTAILTDEGYEVTAIAEPDHASIAKAVGRVSLTASFSTVPMDPSSAPAGTRRRTSRRGGARFRP